MGEGNRSSAEANQAYPVPRSVSARSSSESTDRTSALLRRITDLGPNLISIFDLVDEKTTFANAHWQAFHGMTERSMTEAGISFLLDRIHPDDLPLFHTVAGQLRAAPEGAVLENRYRLRDYKGDFRWIQTWDSVFGVDPSGDLRSVLSTALDITEAQTRTRELRERELQLRQAQKLESLGLMAGGIAHDFNNLLTGILGYVNLTATTLGPDAPQQGYLREIERAGERAAALCSRMLMYSGQRALNQKLVDLRDIWKEAELLLRPALPPGVRLEQSIPTNPLMFEGDAIEVQQVITNLVLNAADAITKKPGTVTVHLGSSQLTESEVRSKLGGHEVDPGTYVYVEVADTGCGFDQETQERIFDPFFSTKGVGRGLGLSTALGIIRSHRGLVDLESQVEAGTRIRVMFPAREGSGDTRVVLRSHERVQELAGKRVLVVDDDPMILQVVERVLQNAGATVTSAASGEEAHLRIRRLDPLPDLALIDVTLQDTNGFAVARALEALDSSPAVLLMSGYMKELGTTEAPRLFLSKPFSPTVLIQAAVEALEVAGLDRR